MIFEESRPPGVYSAVGDMPAADLEPADTRIAGFVGVAAMGPLDRAVRIESWNDFVQHYGVARRGYLSAAVRGFFLNGGSICYVVRVARDANCSQTILTDSWGLPTLSVRASSEGEWGNNLALHAAPSIAAATFLTVDIALGTGNAQVASTNGFETGALVRISDGEHVEHVVLTAVNDRTLAWASSTPITRPFPASGPTRIEALGWDLTISCRDRRETFQGLQQSSLSRRYAPRVINGSSRLVKIESIPTTTPPPFCQPVTQEPIRLVAGSDGAENLTPDDFIGHDRGPAQRTGLARLAAIEEVSLLAAPDAVLLYERAPSITGEIAVREVQRAILNQCEALQDRFAVLDLPNTRKLDLLERWSGEFHSAYGAFYFPWLAGDGSAPIPPSGHILGMIANCDTRFGCHKAPANEVILGSSALALSLSERDYETLARSSINALRSACGRGIRPLGARTLSSDERWRHINVNRLFINIRRTVSIGTRWAVFESNNPGTWSQVERQVATYLEAEWKKGALTGESASDAFFVKCDAETNADDHRAAGRMAIEIGFAPTLPAEFILLSVTQEGPVQ